MKRSAVSGIGQRESRQWLTLKMKGLILPEDA
jgi:hypothetical protein